MLGLFYETLSTMDRRAQSSVSIKKTLTSFKPYKTGKHTLNLFSQMAKASSDVEAFWSKMMLVRIGACTADLLVIDSLTSRASTVDTVGAKLTDSLLVPAI